MPSISEVRAGASLALGLGDARALLGDHAPAAIAHENQNRIELAPRELARIAERSKDMGVALQVTSDDPGLVEEFRPHVDDKGWSTSLCGPVAQRLVSQWGVP